MPDVGIYDLVQHGACNGFRRVAAKFDRARFRVCLNVHRAMFHFIAG